jgi:hypothetical protein
VILVGIDDTDTLETPGTNQLARRMAAALPAGFACTLALRHQLFFDPRVPYTSQNGSASLLVRSKPGRRAAELLPALEQEMRDWYVAGSDPGLCVAESVPDEVIAFGARCQRALVRQDEAREIAARHGLYLAGFGGTEDGVIGALAAVGLLASGEDGRVVHRRGWTWPDGFSGPQTVAAIHARGVDEVRRHPDGTPLEDGTVDIGKHLRPSYRGGRVVLYVEPWSPSAPTRWRARKLP